MNLKLKPLLSALKDVGRAVPMRTTLPAFCYVKLEPAHDGSLELTVDNSRQRIKRAVPTEDVAGFNPVCLPYKVLFSVLESLGTEAVEIIGDELTVKIKAGTSNFRLRGLPLSEFHKSDNHTVGTGILPLDLADGLDAAAFCVNRDDTQRAIENVLMHAQATSLNVVSFDGNRMAVFMRPLICPEITALIPPESAALIAAELRLPGAQVFHSPNHLCVTQDNGSVTVSLAEGSFVTYSDVLKFSSPTAPRTSVAVEALRGSVRKVMAVSEKDGKTHLIAKGNKLCVSSIDSDDETKDEIECLGEQDFDMVLTTQHLAEALKKFSVTVKLYIGSTGALFAQEGDLTCIMMPRLRRQLVEEK